MMVGGEVLVDRMMIGAGSTVGAVATAAVEGCDLD
jgi:hypothetical protein